MRDKRRRKIGLLFGVMALLGAIVVPGSVAQSTPVRTEVGVLRLHLDNDGKYFRYDTTTPGVLQSINGSCPGAVTSLSGPQWVNLGGGTTSFSLNKVGLKDNGLGVKYLNCGRVDAPNWALRIKLGTGIDVGPGIGVDRAELDLQGWGNATAVADLYFNGTKVDSVTKAISGSGARAIMVIDRAGKPLFDEIRLHPKYLLTSVALRGGGAGSPAAAPGTLRATLGTTDTLFRVVSETDHGPAAKIAFASGPTSTPAGGTMDDVTVKVTDAADNPLSGESVTLASTGLASTPGAQLTNSMGIATFSGLAVGPTVGDYTMTASDAAASLTTDPAPFSITLGELSIAFSEQPTDTIHDEPIRSINDGDVEVTVEDAFGNPAPDATQVDMSIGTDPTDSASLSGTSTGCTPPMGNVCALTSGGVATFSDLAIDTTSSGYQLEAAVSGLGSVLSGTFAITNTDSSCGKDGNPPCTAEFDPDHTVSAPPGTTLIIETNQLFCEDFEGLGIAGTVTIIHDPDLPMGTITPVQFTDSITLPVAGPFPFCKSPTPGAEDPEITGHLAPLCNTIEDGLDKQLPVSLDGQACVTQSVELIGGDQAILHSVLYVNEFDPPRGKH
jgi:hypothetical protein